MLILLSNAAGLAEAVQRLNQDSDFLIFMKWLVDSREVLRDRLELANDEEARGAAKLVAEIVAATETRGAGNPFFSEHPNGFGDFS